ncbi:pyrroline-5-carboxylate reductase [Phocicoccus pinnipedialis]|uniref:Pyrroline-5-carboxylate reductase n=1 Tax=Phocicoccus pinnipedialis TaxID=110845 RepID=A0A6V7RAZ6_9BACL|nr:pyrroline-5-carboxylate reductase [Jeotgalicoccus pinnipedialis]MBP1939903.1 pyrroline-5-carboxylate reductase [Jeotgalicoccus pinnipedialis]CAD2074795.1 Pyrroline-5-carboxylate reductase [Jeotgalicoccus pinnipedialis]
MKIVFYGIGNMASAIFKGMINEGVKPEEIFVTSIPGDPLLELFKEELGVMPSLNDAELLKNADYVVFATKPQDFESVVERVKANLEDKTKLISIMAGTTIETIQSKLNGNETVRIMPNTNAVVQKAVNGVAFSENFTNKEELLKLIETFGTNVLIEESEFNRITAATGSGPAFLYYLYEKYADSLVNLGFSKEQADVLTRELVIGTAEMMKNTDLPLSTLRENITSKKGTTDAGLKSLHKHDIEKIFDQTLEAAKTRGEELSKD